MLERIAHAKINLALHIVGQREDGYHLLDSLVVFTHFGDKITVRENECAQSLIKLTIDGQFSSHLEDGANNLVSRAALALGYKITELHGKPTPVEITLSKNLPIASGIGGGSADAAATLIALKEFWKVDVSLEEIALELGADVPMCLHSKPLRAQGIGDEILQLSIKKPLYMVLVNPNVEVSTPAIFKELAIKTNEPIADDLLNQLFISNEFEKTRNDLQAPAIKLEPKISLVLDALEKTKCHFARMSGSGATCFGLYDTMDLARVGAYEISKKHPNWWCIATSTTIS